MSVRRIFRRTAATIAFLIGASVATEAITTNVVFSNFSFTPKTVTISVGDTVVWKNAGGSHTVTGDGADPFCGTGAIPVSCSETFKSVGTFPYHCIFHESFGMRGTVIVQPAPNTPPTVTIDSPTPGSLLVAPATVTIQATAADTDGTVSRVEFFAGPNLLGMVTTSPFSLIWPNVPAGSYSLTAKATDDKGATATSTAVDINVSNPPAVNNPPTVGLTSPLNGAVYIAPATITLQATAADSDGSIKKVEFFVGPDVVGETTNPPYTFMWSNVPPGVYVLTAEAVDDKDLKTVSALVAITVTSAAAYKQHNFVSDIAGLADLTDANLVNPWGIATSPASPFWVADNHAGLSTIYNSTGGVQTLMVKIPPPPGAQPPSGPTGLVFNDTSDFVLSSGKPAVFIFATENGTISAWNTGAGTDAILKADKSASDAIYKGLAIGNSDGKNYLYAADFHNGKIAVFDANFNPATLAGSFADPNIPAGFAPFNVQNIGGSLYVTYAKQDADKEDDERGPGNGFVDNFDTNGQLTKRFASNGALNSPWGLAVAPAGFGPFSGALLIGNFGDGRINAFDPATGALLGHLSDANGEPIAIEGLWGLKFGNGGNGGEASKLYFTAGIAGGGSLEDHGLFGSIAAEATLRIDSIAPSGNDLAVSWLGGIGPYLVERKNAVSEAAWVNVTATTEHKAVAAKDGDNGFFRVADHANSPKIPLTVSLSGAAERPNPVTSTATGFGSLVLEGNTLTYNITYSGLSGTATAAHIHGAADTTKAAGVLFPLDPVGAFGASGTLAGSKVLDAAQKAALLGGKTYANVHTANNPGGEIRGQIVVAQLQTSLSGAAERPSPVATTAEGYGHLSLIGDQLTYHINYSGLSAVATAAHIHGPADTAKAAGVLFPLEPVEAFGTSGELAGTVKLTPEQLGYFADGQVYANIHTANHPGGEIRGHVSAQITSTPFTAVLSGAAERPTPVTTTASGFALFSLEGDSLISRVSYGGLSGPATAAHIHGAADTSSAAGVLFPLDPSGAFGASGTLAGSKVLDPAQKAALLGGKTYANVHTANNPNGEIRGQVVVAQLQVSLNGAAERPNPVTTTATGYGRLSLIGDELTYHIFYSGLSAAATAAHIHGPADTTKAAGVLFPLESVGAFGTSGELAGTVKLTPEQLANFADGLVYANIHTANNPGGEIRGQITQ